MLHKIFLLLTISILNLSALDAFISPQTLKEHIEDEDLIILDVSPQSLYTKSHINGAIHVNVMDFLQSSSPYMLMKTKEEIELSLRTLGINAHSQIVIYSRNNDTYRLHSSYLAYILIKYGFEDVSILDGGYMAWVFEYQLLATSLENNESIQDGNITLQLHEGLSVGYEYVRDNLENVKVLDSRSPEDYFGTSRSKNSDEIGHIAFASSSYYKDKFLTDGTLRSDYELKEIFQYGLEITQNDEVILYGENVLSASMNWYILYKYLGYKKAKIYEASLLEWGNYSELPMRRFKWE